MPPSHLDYDLDKEIVDINNKATQLLLLDLIYTEKIEVILKWKKYKKSYYIKIQAKASYVY